MKSSRVLLAASALAAGALVAPLPASAATAVGVLGCHGDGSYGLILGSKERLICEFTPYGGGAPQYYAASLTTLGVDVGVTGRTVLKWAVLAAGPTNYEPGTIAGTYVGASANASAFVGGGLNVLVGGTKDTYTLQPLSLTAQEGINAAVGVSKFRLEPALPVAVQEQPVLIPGVPANAVR